MLLGSPMHWYQRQSLLVVAPPGCPPAMACLIYRAARAATQPRAQCRDRPGACARRGRPYELSALDTQPPPLRRGPFDMVSPYLSPHGATPAFECSRGDLPPQVHFIGPLLLEPQRDFVPPAWWDELRSDRPVGAQSRPGTRPDQPGRAAGRSSGARRCKSARILHQCGS